MTKMKKKHKPTHVRMVVLVSKKVAKDILNAAPAKKRSSLKKSASKKKASPAKRKPARKRGKRTTSKK